jgi:hypothetical protein
MREHVLQCKGIPEDKKMGVRLVVEQRDELRRQKLQDNEGRGVEKKRKITEEECARIARPTRDCSFAYADISATVRAPTLRRPLLQRCPCRTPPSPATSWTRPRASRGPNCGSVSIR